MATKAEVKQRALEELAVVPVGQSAQSQHDIRIDTAYTEVYDQLKEEGLAVWASTGTIPDRVAPHLINLMAQNCLNTYGVSNDRYTRITNAASVALREISKLVTPKFESLEEPTDF